MFDNVRSHKTEDVTVGWNSDISLSAALAAQCFGKIWVVNVPLEINPLGVLEKIPCWIFISFLCNQNKPAVAERSFLKLSLRGLY